MKNALYSIQGRLTGIALFFIIGTAVAMGVAGFTLTVNFEKAQFRDHFTLLASSLAGNAELGLLLGNKKMLEDLSRNMLTVRGVKVVEILNRDGAVLARMAEAKVPEDVGTVSAPVRSDPMGQGDSPFLAASGEAETVGQVNLTFSYAGLARLKRLLALRFSLVALVLALGSVLMYWLLSRAIIAPLHGLLAVAGQVSRGQMRVRAEGGALREISTLAEAFNEMLDTLETQRRKLDEAHAAMARQQALAEVGKFSMVVAHEIKNPLAIIKGSVDVLRKDRPLDSATRTQLMGFLDEEIARIDKLVEDFLLFARPQAPDLRPVALGGLVASLSQRVALMPGGDTVFLAMDATLAGLSLRCDPHLLERAVLNIIRNALEVSPVGGRVRVGVALVDGRLLVSVVDEGPGVEAEHLPRLFEPFFSTKAKGTGLGLSIVRDIVQAHGGEVWAANDPGGGACLTIALPVAGDWEGRG